MSETFDRCGNIVVTAVKNGASLADAAREARCGARTVDRWLVKGRLQPSGPYGRFASQIDGARCEQELPDADDAELMDAAELKRLATKAARSGSVAAMKLVHTLQTETPEDHGPDRIDAIRAKRDARRGSK